MLQAGQDSAQLSNMILEKEITRPNWCIMLPTKTVHLSRNVSILWPTMKETLWTPLISHSPRKRKRVKHIIQQIWITIRLEMITPIVTASHLDPFQYACRVSRSVDDALNTGLHFVLQYMDNRAMYAGILFVDFSSAFSTITPDLQMSKLSQKKVSLYVNKSTASWLIISIICKLCPISQPTIHRFICIDATKGCLLSPLLYSLYNNDIQWSLSKIPDYYTQCHRSNKGQGSEISIYRKWTLLGCSTSNLDLNTTKIGNYSRLQETPWLLQISGHHHSQLRWKHHFHHKGSTSIT